MAVFLFLIRAIRRWRALFVLAFLALAAGTVAGAYVKRRNYESSAKILVNLENRGISLSRAEVQFGGTMVQAVEVITSQTEILRARRLIEETIDSLGREAFDEPPAGGLTGLLLDGLKQAETALDDVLVMLRLTEAVGPRERLIERVDKALRVYPVRQAQIIQISFEWRNPRLPPLFLDRYLELYLATVARLNGGPDQPDLMDRQVRRAASELAAAEQELRALDARFGIVDLKREKQTLAERIDRLNGLVSGLPAGPAANAAESGEGGVLAGAQIAALRGQINLLRIERAKAAVGFTADSRTLREFDGQIAAAEAALAASLREAGEALAASRARLEVLQRAESDYNRVGRTLEIAAEAFQTYRKVAEDQRLQRAQETRLRIQVVDPPAVPIRPVGVGRLVLVALSLVVALALALALAAFAEWRWPPQAVTSPRRRRSPLPEPAAEQRPALRLQEPA